MKSYRVTLALVAIGLPLLSFASSHREAPNTAGLPRVDNTDVYLFRSYEPGRAGYVTVIANFIPFQDPGGGPNFYDLDTNALYAININNDGSGQANYSFRFRFRNMIRNLAVPAGGKQTPVPVLNVGPVDHNGKNLNVQQTYSIQMTRSNWGAAMLQNANGNGTTFYKPADNIGKKSIPDYADYASYFMPDFYMPGCRQPGRVFVGQRKEGFVVNVGEIFDLVNTNPVGPRDAEPNDLSHKNVTSIVLELPIGCLTNGKDPVLGAWSTASLPAPGSLESSNTNPGSSGSASTPESDFSGNWVQVSRLSAPLVNEAVIGLPDKDKFNASEPRNDAQFLQYVTNPTLPVLLNALFGNAAQVPGSPRNDLVAAFLTGVKGLNQPANVKPAEMLRLNTSIAPTPPAKQNDLGVLGGDLAGFPNGRRPYDDVTTIELRVLEGALCGKIGSCGAQNSDPNKGAPYTDGARAAGPTAAFVKVSGAINPGDTYLESFPYLNTPLAGSPNGVADKP